MENQVQVKLSLSLANRWLPLGDVARVVMKVVGTLKDSIVFDEERLKGFFEDYKNYRAETVSICLNKFIQKTCVGQDEMFYAECLNEEELASIWKARMHEDYPISIEVYLYLHNQLWFTIIRSAIADIQKGKDSISIKLKVTKKTYDRFYSEIEDSTQKMLKLKEDITCWLHYNRLLEGYKSVLAFKDELIIPVEL